MNDVNKHEEAKSKRMIKVVVVVISIIELVVMLGIVYSRKSGL